MAKPWHRYEQNFINHPKFLVLSPGAICLWLEGKNYCDMHLTDGMIPRDALRTFRFQNRGRIDELLQTIDGYSGPLWEPHSVGFKMHDYLVHNPCRDEVIERMAAADSEKAKKKQYLKEWREKKKGARTENEPETNPVRGEFANGSRTVLKPDKQKQIQKQIQKEQEQEIRTHTLRARATPLMGNEHRAHAECGRVCVPAFLHRQFKDSLGGNEQEADTRLRNWYGKVLDALTEDEPVPSDAPKFWRPLFDAEFVKTAPAKAERDYEAERRAEVARLDALLQQGRTA